MMEKRASALFFSFVIEMKSPACAGLPFIIQGILLH
jgi:hypothetical protein